MEYTRPECHHSVEREGCAWIQACVYKWTNTVSLLFKSKVLLLNFVHIKVCLYIRYAKPNPVIQLLFIHLTFSRNVVMCWYWLFVVDTAHAGPGNLEIMVNDGTILCTVQNRGNRQFHASFTPKEAIPHFIQMKFNSKEVPGKCMLQSSES